MKVGVFGAGAIGCFLGGALQAAGHEVQLVGRLGDELRAHGLTLTDERGVKAAIPAGDIRYGGNAASLAGCDAVLVTVKSAATAEAARELAAVLAPGAVVVSFQNGVRNAAVLREGLPAATVLAGMVPFNVLRQGAGRFHRGTSGPLAMEGRGGAGESLAAALRRARFAVELRDDLAPIQWTKLLMNLNNALNALSGIPLRQELSQRAWRRVLAASIAEGLDVLGAAGIRPARVGPVLPRLLPFILGLPDPLFTRVAASMLRIDPEARSSMWDDLERRRLTEIDELQGEILRLAERYQRPAPTNRAVHDLIRAAEQAGSGSPRLIPDAIIRS